jgi:hypothetical protein
MWESHPDFPGKLAELWLSKGAATSAGELLEKMNDVSSHLSTWDRTVFGSVKGELRRLNNELETLRDDQLRLGPSHAELKIVERIRELNHREELMWRQGSRVNWLTAGDKNTRFFHLRASNRRRRNKITWLKNQSGQFTEDEGELKQLVSEFYENLYLSEGTLDMGRVLSTVPVQVTVDMNEELLKPYNEQEVKEALFQMFPTKAPGPDGFPAHFFQRHWELCGSEITSVVLRMLNGSEDLSCINETLIVLIPKVASPEEVGQFRPISLCNVLYKIASKVLANRLKIILPQIVSEEQSAFVPGRLITDNIITAYECMHFMKRKRAVDLRCCALKLDMKKAYDRVEWNYLSAIMIQLGFHRDWVSTIMRLVTSVSFSVLFNGDRLNHFKPTRSLRQGDPISPYLFLLTAEGLTGLLKSKIQSSALNGVKVASSAPTTSHLLFADDSLLFFRANEENAVVVKEVLNVYCEASGQQINTDKSSIHFAQGVRQQSRDLIKGVMEVHNQALSEKYFGMPTDVGAATMGVFKYLKDRMWSRVEGWMEKCLSAGGKEVLIKTVAQALATYSMSCFRLPKGLCEHLTSLIRNFWWGSKDAKRRVAWVAWDSMVKPKPLGGGG